MSSKSPTLQKFEKNMSQQKIGSQTLRQKFNANVLFKPIFEGEKMLHFNHSTANFYRKPNYMGANTTPTSSE